MFLEELTPIARELIQNPIAFLGGFTAGLLRLDLNQDPVKTWLETQTGTPRTAAPPANSDRPQSISIE